MTDKIQIIKARNKVQDIARLFNINFAKGKAICPFHPDSDPSLTVTKDGMHFKCWSCDEHGDCIDFYQKMLRTDTKTAVNDLYKRLYGDTPPAPLPQRTEAEAIKREEANPATIKIAQSLYQHSIPLRDISDRNCPAWLYLQNRSINIFEHRKFISPKIRYKANIQLPQGIKYEENQHALICGLTTDNDIKAVQRLYFKADGTKNTHIFGKHTKRTLGQMGDSLIPVWQGFRPGSETLIITEGVEDALAYAELWPQDPIASAGGLSRIRNIKIPDRFTDITLAADAPTNQQQQKLMQTALQEFAQQGKYGRIEYPPDNCKDFNDYLIEQRNG